VEGTQYGLGRTPTQQEIAAWDIDGRPDGMGLPDGSGSVARGNEVYSQQCVACHGPDLKGQMGALVGGIGSLDTDKPLRTVGSYWPYAVTLFDYIHRSMPFDHPQSLSADDVYAVTAYILAENGLVAKDAIMNATTLPNVEMPNRDGFLPDPRPDVWNTACRRNCRSAPVDVDTTAGTGRAETGVGGGGSPQ
jgi:cytochrome c